MAVIVVDAPPAVAWSAHTLDHHHVLIIRWMLHDRQRVWVEAGVVSSTLVPRCGKKWIWRHDGSNRWTS